MNIKALILWFLGFFGLCRGQNRPLINRPQVSRPLINRPLQHDSSYSPCSGDYDTYDSVDDGRSSKTLLLAAAGGAALGYHLANKNRQQPFTINNNIHNDYPPPCIVVQGGGGGGVGGGGIIGGILSHHPILSNVLQGGWLGGGVNGEGGVLANAVANNRQNVNWNRAIRQFSRIVRPITRGFR